MARLNRSHDIDPTVPVRLDAQPSQLEDDDDFSVLDDAILDVSTPAMSPVVGRRRDSLAEHGANFPRSEGSWCGYQYNADSTTLHQQSTNVHAFVASGGRNYSNTNGALPVQYSQPAGWQLHGTSGSCTPTADYEGIVSDFDNSASTAYTTGPSHLPSQADIYGGLQVHTTSVFPSNSAFAASPQSAKDWMSASSSDGLDLRSSGSHVHPRSPVFAANSLVLGRDGIRKKNARFEIPAERNLRTIDMLINQTSDEQVIKELKQQKRLLRNRQAALDSRQRKKQHTERLEEEKKHYTTIITELEEALGDMKVREAEWDRQKEGWTTSQHQYEQYVENLLIEKEELVRCHTMETADLRKKNVVLTEQLQRMESTAMSTAPSSTGFSADFSDFDPLTMESSPWDNFSIANDFVDTDSPRGPSIAIASSYSKSLIKDDDKTAASSFLLMLLLCGAWVASRDPMAPTSILPTMPKEMRVASATILDNIYEDAGIHLQEASRTTQHALDAVSVAAPHPERKTTLSAFEIASLSHAPLDTLHHRLTMPNEEQLRHQAFSLTPSQYNQLSSDGGYDLKEGLSFRPGRKIGDALAAVRSANEGSAADVYTRSLMWDRVPREVVKDFARMIAENNAGAQGSWKSEPLN